MKIKESYALIFMIGICGCAPGPSKHIEKITPEQYIKPYPSEHRVGYTPQDTLKGLTGVGVGVIIGGSGVKEYGLTEQAIQDFTESQLRKHKINVLSGKEYPRVIGRPHLCVSINARIKKADEPVLASISLTLQQMVLLDRNRGIICGGQTWGTQLAATFEKDNLNDVYKMIEIMIEEFSRAYHDAN